MLVPPAVAAFRFPREKKKRGPLALSQRASDNSRWGTKNRDAGAGFPLHTHSPHSTASGQRSRVSGELPARPAWAPDLCDSAHPSRLRGFCLSLLFAGRPWRRVPFSFCAGANGGTLWRRPRWSASSRGSSCRTGRVVCRSRRIGRTRRGLCAASPTCAWPRCPSRSPRVAAAPRRLRP